uniref:Uncharacterized protein n=1 Tax=Cucumis melo TaxID=3656 RepID=A0A9I9E5T1_CUCME
MLEILGGRNSNSTGMGTLFRETEYQALGETRHQEITLSCLDFSVVAPAAAGKSKPEPCLLEIDRHPSPPDSITLPLISLRIPLRFSPISLIVFLMKTLASPSSMLTEAIRIRY